MINSTQVVLLPTEARFPQGVRQVKIRVKGNERILAPIDQSWDDFFKDGFTASKDFMTERASQDQSERDTLKRSIQKISKFRTRDNTVT